MKERILLVGEDALLLETRAMILAEWQTVKSNTSEFRAHAEKWFDVVILCHSVPLETAKAAIARIEQLDGGPSVLTIRHLEESEVLDGDVHLLNLYESPGWLRDHVARLLASKRTPRMSPPHEQSPQSPLPGADAGN